MNIKAKLSREKLTGDLHELLKAHLNLDDDREITDADTFIELGADSLDMVEMVLATEQEYNFDMDDDALEKAKTVGQFLDLVQRYV
ncbi:phosphopantetheine-binding protein [Tardiphaga sp. 862_B3_N1_1]|uniref:phosphopantetheine-binding protein n=1 Tax=Tardiphaga sp. 862_B3_N1_1 TaxID=3240763 RepID=UPI003F8A197B